MTRAKMIRFFLATIFLILIQAVALNGEEKTQFLLLKEQPIPKKIGEPDAIKFYIPADGIYKITYRQIKNLGIAPEEIDFSNTSLFGNGKEYPFLIVGYEEDNRFDKDDYMVFYATKPRGTYSYRSLYSDENVFRLEFNRRGLFNQPQVYHSGEAQLPKAGDVLRRRIHFEQDLFLDRFAHPFGEDTDYCFYIPVTWLLDKNRRVLNFNLPGLNPNAVEQTGGARIYVYGKSELNMPNYYDHNIKFSINDHPLGERRWRGVKECLLENFNIPLNVFKESANEIVFELINVNDLKMDHINVDWYEIEYPIKSEAISNALDFKVARGFYKQTREISIGNFSNNKIYLYDIGENKFITPAVSMVSGRNYTASFVTEQSTVQEYFIAAEPALLAPSKIKLSQYMGLKTSQHAAEYIIITHENFLAQAERLAKYRAKRGAKTKVIPVDYIYDEFNGSNIHPTAIKQAIAHIYNNWQQPKLKYVLLIGDWSWDWHNIDRQANPTGMQQNFIPTWYVPHNKIEYATDSYFASVDDDFVPEVALGRLPVKTPAEADMVVNKIINYEINFTQSGWRHRVLLTASALSDFHDYCNRLASDYLQDYAVDKAYCNVTSSLDVTQRIIDACNEGVALLLYAGHGSRYYWLTGTNIAHSSEELQYNFQPEKIDLINNPHMTPMVFAATCFTNNFDNPAARNCIGEKFLIKNNGGAIGVIASSSYSYIQNDEIFMQEMFNAAFNDNDNRYMGDIFLYASRACPSEEAVKMFLLLGDPLTRHGLVRISRGEPQVKGSQGKTTYEFY
ncbi:MAG TPA: C25 family cysteine peptidase [Candidatus Sumerlaeota bacterium]|nr:MAG: Gingipain R1 precursor [candidate division BRC1 bacterium ADurb.Bin183]HOE63245.1 C25 family cysteine peptidase [Candidatus Sumerlaeota bacterium]HON50603.1 C25 family cysteine peptidase [Candidatus Sumerlaeota bacterium]HOR65425.1 C25 family cysteine peptidase [Candidatus Sumerlaeota bacterium]HRR29832.1 C25 family cysteine peptidase [Candidatus Sumerlaeia bacterium]